MKRMMYRKIALPVAVALALAACGSDEGGGAPPAGGADGPDTTADTTGSTDDENGADGSGETTAGPDGECPSEGGTLTLADSGEFRGFDPLITTSTSGTTGAAGLLAVYDALMYWNFETGEFEPWVAESLEHDEELVEWTVRLRGGITFGNGDALTADAVRANIERNQSDQNLTGTRSSALRIAGIDVVDDHTVVLTMEEPNGGVPAMLATGVGMITNPAVVDSMSAEEFNLGVPGAGVGPFEPLRFAPGEELALVAKDDYWGGPVCLDEVRFVGVADQDSRFDAFMLEEFDAVQLRGGYVDIEETVRPAGLPMYTEVRNASGAVFVNGGLPLGDPDPVDVRLRRAIAHAIDVDAIDQRVNNGYGLPSAAIVHPDSTLYSGAEGLPYDPDLARELVEEVRADGEWDGQLELQCTEIGRENCIALEAALVSVGFELDVQIVTVASVLDLFSREDRDFDLIAFSFSMGDQRPHEALAQGLARMGYDDEVLDDLLDQLQRTADLSTQQELMTQIQERWNEIVPAAVFNAAGQSWVWRDDVGGLKFTMGSIMRLDGAWIE